MFVILATKPLYDGTKGRRFNILGQKGFFMFMEAIEKLSNKK